MLQKKLEIKKLINMKKFIIFLNSSPMNILRYSLSEFAKKIDKYEKIDNTTLILP